MQGQPHIYVFYTWLLSTALFLVIVICTDFFFPDLNKKIIVTILIGGVLAIATAITLIYLLIYLFVRLIKNIFRKHL